MKPIHNGSQDQREIDFFTFIDRGIQFFTAEETHQRINNILLGPLERPALQWLAERMPAWVTPDSLTGLGLLAAVMIFAGYALTNVDKGFLWLASLGFAINWFGDSLDGTLARHRHIERPRYGFFVDHTVDAFSEVLIFLGIGLSPYVNFNFACLALIGYMLLSILVYITTYVNGVFRISYIRLGPTEMRVIAILANTLVFFAGNPMLRLPFGPLSFYNLVALVLAGLFFGAFIVVTLMQALELAKIDRGEKLVGFTAETARQHSQKDIPAMAPGLAEPVWQVAPAEVSEKKRKSKKSARQKKSKAE
jgi:archaetidylinositol phosphate synthase